MEHKGIEMQLRKFSMYPWPMNYIMVLISKFRLSLNNHPMAENMYTSICSHFSKSINYQILVVFTV